MKPSTPFASITRIRSLFGKWRALGHEILPCGTERIGRMEDGGEVQWLHVLHRGLKRHEADTLSDLLCQPLPAELNSLYRRYSGMDLWSGSFRIHGYRPIGANKAADETEWPDDLIAFNRRVRAEGWLPAQALAFAESGWDESIYVLGLTPNPQTVHRCDRRTGEVLLTHSGVWNCIARKLDRIDRLMFDDMPTLPTA